VSTVQALATIAHVRESSGADLAYLYDAYHMQRMEGNLIWTIEHHGASFGHVQVADAPLRSQPGLGEIAYERVFAALEASAYDGPIGLEYKPQGPSAESFGWMRGSEG
jgi:hydroxypyruvate isomerase